jgi:hypothetical protein
MAFKIVGIQRKSRGVEREEFTWRPGQEGAMMSLKEALVTAPTHLLLTYVPKDGVLGVDACGLGFGAVLQHQDRNGKRHLMRYKSCLSTHAESRYDALKLE